MKGDFTRSTFQPEKHYTSVRMQQGRLQLDSDWNEQVDIEAYLRHAQSVDMIGADSGVPTSGGDSGEPYRDSFKISITPDGSDLAIAPGRLYTNGTFCELEATPFVGTFTASNRLQVNTLIVDGRQLEKYQWIEIAPDNNPGLKISVQIANVNNQTLELTLNLDSEKIKANVLKVKEYTKEEEEKEVEKKPQLFRLRRVVTYNTQADYINPEERLTPNTFYLVYVDVWQRHITAIEDPNIREVALNTFDTTTRTKTVWQIKLKKVNKPINEDAGDSQAVDQLRKGFPENKQLNNLNDPDWEYLMQQVWGKFLTQQEQRQALMNACAKLCSSSGSQSNGIGYQRLENLLYRVEIYEPSQTEQGENQGNNGTNKATFKWSRDNGSIVSSIEKIEGNVITIRKSSQDAWMSSRTGQWLEITNEEMELKGQPGVMVPLNRAFDTKIEFNEFRIVNGPIPNNPTKVRLWSHEVKNAPNGVIPIADDWIELETGIKVRFYKDSVYRTGDYWLIPARNATNDIEWPHNQAELQKRQPLPQPPKGIHHDYCSLALIQFNAQVKGKEEKAEQEEQEPKNIRDLRIIFPPLMRCLDKAAGGIITGTLEIQSDLYVTGRYQKQVDRYVDGKVGIGTKEPLARFHTQAAKPIPGLEQITSNEQQVNLHEGSNFTTEFHEGDLLKVDGLERIITKVEEKSLTINETLAITEPKSFEYQQPIARLENGEGNPQFVVLANGNTGIGTPTPYNQLDVVRGVAIGQAYAGKTKAPDNGLLVDGTVGIGVMSSPAQKLVVENGNVGIGYNDSEQSAMLAVKEKVGIGITKPNAQLHVIGTFQVDAKPDANTLIRLTQNNQLVNMGLQDNGLQFSAINLTGYSFDQPITAQQGIVTNRIENYNNQSLILQTNNRERIAITHDTGNVGIGIDPDTNAKLNLAGALKFTNNQQSATVSFTNDNGLQFSTTNLIGYSFDRPIAVTLTQNNETDFGSALQLARNTQSLNLGFQNQNFVLRTNNQDRITITHDGKVGIGTPNSPSQLDINGTAKATQLEGNSLKLKDVIILRDVIIEQFTNDSNLRNNQKSVPTENAVKAYVNKAIAEVEETLVNKADWLYVDTEISNLRTNFQSSLATKAGQNGDPKLDFNAKSLNVESISAKILATTEITAKQDSNGISINAKQVLIAGEAVSNGFYQVSSRALKKEINDLSSQEVATILRTLNPVKFIYTEDEKKTPHAGFIAEDTPDLLTANDKQAIKVVDIVAILTKVAQDHRKTLSDVVKIVKKQQAEIAILTEKVKALEKQNNE